MNLSLAKPVENWKAEVMSVGDEIITGQRLDTNTQWISQALGDLGIAVHYHSSVGDDLNEHVAVIQVALNRADLIVMTGGLGPTADDLTRQAIALAAGAALQLDEAELTKIEAIFKRGSRPMPDNNRLQAFFPAGSIPIPNPEGTAPGIDLTVDNSQGKSVRIIALPGVPAEMKQMWTGTIESRLRQETQTDSVFYHHTIHCFGAGESLVESMLPNLIERGRDPRVGITASNATISLRVTTREKNIQACMEKIKPTIDLIKSKLGDLVFGENGETLADVAAQSLMNLDHTVAICDLGLHGKVGDVLLGAGVSPAKVRFVDSQRFECREADLDSIAFEIQQEYSGCNIAIVIGPINRDQTKIGSGDSEYCIAFNSPSFRSKSHLTFGGHSAWREERAVKQVLNQIRLFLRQML